MKPKTPTARTKVQKNKMTALAARVKVPKNKMLVPTANQETPTAKNGVPMELTQETSWFSQKAI